MCNEPYKCLYFLRCCWKSYQRSFQISKVDRVPSRQTVDSISVQKVAVVQKQLESLVGESDMTLYTDET